MTTLDAIKRFFTSAHILHLERECEYLRGQNNMLLLQLTEALRPKQTPVASPREFPKFTPVMTSWEQYRAAEIARQEAEEEDGTHSSGR